MIIQPTPAPLGAEVGDIDIARAVGLPAHAAPWPEIHRAFADHKVLFFRDQDLETEQLVAFARHFGPIGRYTFAEPLPDNPDVVAVIKEPYQTSNFGGLWHTDSPYLERPAAATVLYALEIPPEGGDTIWADAVAAFGALETSIAARLMGLHAVHSAGKTNGAIRADTLQTGSMKAVHEDDMVTLEAIHPLVRTHPVTGERGLFLSPAHTTHIEGLEQSESDALLETLFDHVTQARFSYRFKWTVGTVAIWDNRATLHYPLNDYHGHRRSMLRVTIDGDVPV